MSRKPDREHKYLPQIALRVPPEWIEKFEHYAAESGWIRNRSDFIREAIAEWFERNERKSA